jgi:hypothetical protein
MNDTVTDRTSEAEAAAAVAVERHHALLAAELASRVEAVVAAARSVDAERVREGGAELAQWCRTELVPHASAEESTLYAAARERPEGRLLVDGMLTEHAVIVGLVTALSGTAEPIDLATAARALQVVFDNHLAKENTLVLPLLVADPTVSVADLLSGMHELIGEQHTAPAAATAEHR